MGPNQVKHMIIGLISCVITDTPQTQEFLTIDDYNQFVRVFELSLSGVAITWFRGMKDKY